jgi:Site-specific recombinases, DNA invertase Pin homologs
VVVVYKIDRLTRSSADFAKLVETFESRSISFVAVTQQFNTTTSMGRLTLNVLLSFAQFERELASERVRDKMAASRKKGKWTGGTGKYPNHAAGCRKEETTNCSKSRKRGRRRRCNLHRPMPDLTLNWSRQLSGPMSGLATYLAVSTSRSKIWPLLPVIMQRSYGKVSASHFSLQQQWSRLSTASRLSDSQIPKLLPLRWRDQHQLFG